MGGSTKVVDTTPKDITGLRSAITQYLMGSPGQGAAAGAGGGGGGMFDPRQLLGGGGGMLPGGGGMGGPVVSPGPQPGAGSPFDRINASGVNLPGQVQLPGVPQIGGVQMIGGLPQATTDYSNLGGPASRGMVRNLTAPGIPGVGTQSVDQLGGANSAFFNNMVGQLAPLFNQQRALALGQAKEASGNLTGSGYAGALGDVVNRSLAQQQAELAGYANQGLQTEVQRQLGVAGLNNQGNIEQARLAFGAGQGNQQADQQFMQYMLSRGQAGAQLGQAGEFQNIGTALHGALANQGVDLQRQLANQGVQSQYGLTQAQLDQARNMGIFGTQSQTANENAQRFFQLLQAMGLGGVGPGEVVKSGGAGAILGPLLGAAGTIGGTLLGGPAGGMAGGAAGSRLGGAFG